jgi:hypothetical protein
METFLIVKKKRIKKISKDEHYGRSSTDRVGCCRTRMLEAWIEEEDEDNPIKRKASQASNNVTALVPGRLSEESQSVPFPAPTHPY